jgi:predicted ester cyclase
MTDCDVIRRVVEMYRRAFPDLEVKVEILMEAKDRIAWQRTLRATHQSDFKGARPRVVPSCGATW